MKKTVFGLLVVTTMVLMNLNQVINVGSEDISLMSLMKLTKAQAQEGGGGSSVGVKCAPNQIAHAADYSFIIVSCMAGVEGDDCPCGERFRINLY